MKKFGNLLWGIVFITIGIIIGGNSLGITDINIFFDGWWTLFIIVPCFIGIFRENEKTGNVIGLLIGVALLLACQGILEFDLVWKLILPAILIAIGISFIFKDSINNKISKEINRINKSKNATDKIEYCATFSGQNIKFDQQEFKGAELTAVFGGVKCDLKNSIINEDVVIETSAIFGGVDIYVPENVNVKVKSVPIFGGVSNKKQDNISGSEHTIYVNATAVFGGVEIK